MASVGLWEFRASIPAWKSQALCKGLPQSWFFPPEGMQMDERKLRGKRFCKVCPVKEECLEEALGDRRLDYGVRGGLTSRQRVCLRRKMRRLEADAGARALA